MVSRYGDEVRIAIALVGLLACNYAPSPATGDAGGDDAATRIDALIDTPGAGDSDGDGVLDSVDNCPTVPNPDQHDEDVDLIGDACDPCPQFSINIDSDGDGLGDLCDPHPGVPGDQLTSFFGFGTAGGLPAGITAQAGNPADWSVALDQLHLASNDTQHIIEIEGGFNRSWIEIGGFVSTATPALATFAAVFDADQTQTYFACSVVFTDTPGRILQEFNNGSFTALATIIGTPTPGISYVIRGGLDDQLNCTFVGGINVAIRRPGTSHNESTVGVRARNVTLDITYIAVYRSP